LDIYDKLGFILLAYDEEKQFLYKVGEKQLSLKSDEFETLVTEADRTIRQIETLEQIEYNEEVESKVEELCRKVKSLYKRALEIKPDKYVWLKLGRFYSKYGSFLEKDLDRIEIEAVQCYMKALNEHLKDFPELLMEIGSASDLYYNMRLRNFSAYISMIRLSQHFSVQ